LSPLLTSPWRHDAPRLQAREGTKVTSAACKRRGECGVVAAGTLGPWSRRRAMPGSTSTRWTTGRAGRWG
jgi:hypothetical protein